MRDRDVPWLTSNSSRHGWWVCCGPRLCLRACRSTTPWTVARRGRSLPALLTTAPHPAPCTSPPPTAPVLPVHANPLPPSSTPPSLPDPHSCAMCGGFEPCVCVCVIVDDGACPRLCPTTVCCTVGLMCVGVVYGLACLCRYTLSWSSALNIPAGPFISQVVYKVR